MKKLILLAVCSCFRNRFRNASRQ